jgi:transcriptional regulator with XRE-family HTH domain
MRDETTVMRETLLTIRDELDQRGVIHKVLAAKAGVGTTTWFSWFPQNGTPQVPSLAFLPALAKALPGDLLSLLVPDGFHIVPDPEGLDYDEFSAGCRAFIDAKEQAHHPESPAGRDLSECEQEKLRGIVVHLPIKGTVAA